MHHCQANKLTLANFFRMLVSMTERVLTPKQERNRRRFKKMRESWGLKTFELADYLGKTKRCIEHYESGRTPVPALVLRVMDLNAKERKEAAANVS